MVNSGGSIPSHAGFIQSVFKGFNMHTVPASVQHSLNQPHYPTRHQYVEAKEPSDTPTVEDDGFHLTQVARGSWGFASTLVGKEFTGNIQIEADGTFSMRVTCNNKISQLTH